MNDKVKILILILLTLLIISIVNMMSANKKDNEIVKTFNIYKDTSSVLLNSYHASQIKDAKENVDKVGEYTCKNKECKYYNVIKDYIVIYDEEYFIYNYTSKEKIILNISKENYLSINIIWFDDEIYGLTLHKDGNKNAYYSLKDNKYTIPFNERTISFTENLINKGYALGNLYNGTEKTYEYSIIDINTGGNLLTSNSKLNPIENAQFLYITESFEEENVKIYNSELQLLFDGKTYNQYIVLPDGNIMLSNLKDRYFSKYDSIGKLIRNSKKYKSIELVMEDYVIVVDNDNYLKIVDYNDKSVAKILKYTDELNFNYKKSYKTENGITIFISTNNDSNNCDKFYYDFTTKGITKDYIESCNK